MSVLTEHDRNVVAAAIVRARAPRARLTRTQALVPHVRRPVRAKTVGAADRAPAQPVFLGFCVYCGSPAERNTIACQGHADLPAIDSSTSAVVTRNTNGTRRFPYPGSAAGASQEKST